MARGPLLAFDSPHLYKESVSVTKVFLLGSAASLATRPLATLVVDWRKAGIQVDTHDYDDQRSDEALIEDLGEALVQRGQQRGVRQSDYIIGGFSRGARLAASLARREPVRALLCLGFPFHKRGAPKERHGLETLTDLQVPTLIIQGPRDAHGSLPEVRGYPPLPACIHLHWLTDGNHRWQAREKSEVSDEDLLRSASAATIDFLHGTLQSSRDA
jgi:predicted alpha/beta-hydrolase family hydrolase